MKTRARPAPERLAWRKGGRGKATPRLPPPSLSRQARRPSSLRLPAPARSQPGALPSRRPAAHTYPWGRITLHPVGHLAAPQEAPRRPSPTLLPQLSGPHQNVCATRRPGQSPGRPQLPTGKSGPRRGGGGDKGVACAPGTPSRGVPQSEGRRSAGTSGGGGQRQYSPVPQSPS